MRPALAALLLLLPLACHKRHTLAPGGTGSLGIVPVGGKLKLYVPLFDNTTGDGVLAVVDLGLAGQGVAGARALLTDVVLGAEIPSTVAGSPAWVVAGSATAPLVWFVDPRTDALVRTLPLGPQAAKSAFSGGGGYVTGIAIDPDAGRAMLSVWNGFAIVDLGAQAIARTILAAPSENFGYDSAARRIIAPFYDCMNSGDRASPPPTCNDYRTADGRAVTDGLNVIDVEQGTVFTYQNAAAADATQAVGSIPDAAAIDPASGLALVSSEGQGTTTIIDLSKARFDSGARAVTAPARSIPNMPYTGLAVVPGGRLALLEDESSAQIAVVDITSGAVARATLPDLPDGSGWTNPGDPHGVAAALSLDGKAIGVLVNDQERWVARIDLEGLAAAGGTIDKGRTAAFVTYLDARTRE